MMGIIAYPNLGKCDRAESLLSYWIVFCNSVATLCLVYVFVYVYVGISGHVRYECAIGFVHSDNAAASLEV